MFRLVRHNSNILKTPFSAVLQHRAFSARCTLFAKPKDAVAHKEDENPENFHAKRLEDLALLESKKIPAYPEISSFLPRDETTATLKHTAISKFKELYDSALQATQKLYPAEHGESVMHHVVGRIIAKREASNKLVFYTIQDEEGSTLQLMLTKKDYEEAAAEGSDAADEFATMNRVLRRGDVIGAKGFPAKTGTGELSLVPHKIKLLAPSLRPLPHYRKESIEDHESRYRNRSFDFLVNGEQHNIKKVFHTRAKVIKYIRNFFDERGFLEVETPIVSLSSGGANAKPFETHLNALNLDLKLRISPELFLKQLVIGGFPKVYEIGKVFRNEGVDATHNPEFTSIESYEAFADYEQVMKMTEDLLSGLVQHLFQTYKIKIRPPHSGKSEEVEQLDVDFTPPFTRISVMEFLRKELAAIGENTETTNGEITLDHLKKIAKNNNLHPKADPSDKRLNTKGYWMDLIISKLIEPQCINPTFVCDHPIELSPLAKQKSGDSRYTDRFELFIVGKELCNAYTELNDPREQRKRFEQQQKMKDDFGDQEAHEMDEHFCRALELGLPPTGGWGCGIDRLVMMLTNTIHIRDVLFFPLMKPLAEQKAQEKKVPTEKQ